MATVSFDFDHTLWDEDHRVFIDETVALMRQHIVDGDRVIIVTSRTQRWADESKELLQSHLKLDLEVFSCPGNADDVWDKDMSKSDALLIEGACKHFDDIPDCSSLRRAKENGIEILLPPATHATNVVVTRMY